MKNKILIGELFEVLETKFDDELSIDVNNNLNSMLYNKLKIPLILELSDEIDVELNLT